MIGAAVAIVVVLVLVFYPGGVPNALLTASEGPRILVGAPAQSFAIKRVDGTQDSLANYRGDIVYMNLWATWCPPCRDEMPDLERFYKEYRNRDVIVLGVDQGEGRTVVAKFLREHGITYPNLLDENQTYGRAYNALGLPTTVIVGRDGRIVRGIDGAMRPGQMRAYLKPLLAAR